MWLRFWHRSSIEKQWAFQSLMMSLVSVAALRLIGFRHWKEILCTYSSRRVALQTIPGSEVRVAETCASVVNMVARNTPWGIVTCLPRSLTLWWLLRQNGIDGELHIGVRKEAEKLIAHAWITYRGVVIGEAEHEKYTSFERAVLTARLAPVLPDSILD
jgi:hypothetical protein